VKRALIGGVGNVLLGDDGVGPFILRLLESQYSFGDGVELVDLGTPALDLTHQIVSLHSLILIDSVKVDPVRSAPGTVVLYQKEDILRIAPAQRVDPHSPALSECLMTAEMLGSSPQNVLLVGIVGASYEPECALSPAVLQSVERAIDAVLRELQRLGFTYQKKPIPDDAGLWWSNDQAALSEVRG